MAIHPNRRWLAGMIAAAMLPLLSSANEPTSNFADRLLAAHNRERASMGIKPLVWNPALAISAGGWANHLARTGRFEHAPENPYDVQGENIWGGSRGWFRLESMVDAWVREKRNFRPGVFPANSATGHVEDVGHYTQVMWRDTKDVGCAIAHDRDEDLLVCRYSDAGNYVGERPF